MWSKESPNEPESSGVWMPSENTVIPLLAFVIDHMAVRANPPVSRCAPACTRPDASTCTSTLPGGPEDHHFVVEHCGDSAKEAVFDARNRGEEKWAREERRVLQEPAPGAGEVMASERAYVDGIGRGEVEEQIGGHDSGCRYQIRRYDDRGRLVASGAEQNGPEGKHSHQSVVGDR